jgi:hypothetical protein
MMMSKRQAAHFGQAFQTLGSDRGTSERRAASPVGALQGVRLGVCDMHCNAGHGKRQRFRFLSVFHGRGANSTLAPLNESLENGPH